MGFVCTLAQHDTRNAHSRLSNLEERKRLMLMFFLPQSHEDETDCEKIKYFWLVKEKNAIQDTFWRLMLGFLIKSTQSLTLKPIETNVIVW